MIAGFASFGSYWNAASFTDGFAAALIVGAAFAAFAGATGSGLFTRLLQRTTPQ
jgi:hypothetical protein